MAVRRLLYCWAIIVISSVVLCGWSVTAFRVPFVHHRLSRACSNNRCRNNVNIDIKSLFEGDVVVVSHNNVMSLAAVTSSRKTLQPLALRTTSGLDEGGMEIILYEDEEREPFGITEADLGDVVDDVVFTQRCVEDRVSNPHGEHAEDVWLVSNQNIIKGISTASIILPLRSGH